MVPTQLVTLLTDVNLFNLCRGQGDSQIAQVLYFPFLSPERPVQVLQQPPLSLSLLFFLTTLIILFYTLNIGIDESMSLQLVKSTPLRPLLATLIVICI